MKSNNPRGCKTLNIGSTKLPPTKNRMEEKLSHKNSKKILKPTSPQNIKVRSGKSNISHKVKEIDLTNGMDEIFPDLLYLC